VETGKELRVQEYIDVFYNEIIEHTFVPKRKLIEKRSGIKHTVLKTLFPGYVFINADMSIDLYYKLKKIPRLIKPLGTGDYYSPVDASEIDTIKKLVGEGDTIDFSDIFYVNSKVYIKSGPLLGMEGVIRRINKHHERAQVVLYLMGSPKTVEIGINVLMSNSE
jgi:Transcription antiterminator